MGPALFTTVALGRLPPPQRLPTCELAWSYIAHACMITLQIDQHPNCHGPWLTYISFSMMLGLKLAGAKMQVQPIWHIFSVLYRSPNPPSSAFLHLFRIILFVFLVSHTNTYCCA